MARPVGRTVDAVPLAHTQKDVAMQLPEDLLAVLRGPALCYVATLMPDGSPQLTRTWADTDGDHVVINIVQGSQKARNLARDPRVTVAVSDPAEPVRFHQVRGRAVALTTDGAAASIDALSEKYTGRPYRWYGGRDQVRLLVRIRAEHVTVLP